MQKSSKIYRFSMVSIHPVRSVVSSSPCMGSSVRTRHGRLNDISSSNSFGSGSLATSLAGAFFFRDVQSDPDNGINDPIRQN
ncbi:hypothetical protein ACLOJK_011328 [Asimina triloba]